MSIIMTKQRHSLSDRNITCEDALCPASTIQAMPQRPSALLHHTNDAQTPTHQISNSLTFLEAQFHPTIHEHSIRGLRNSHDPASYKIASSSM